MRITVTLDDELVAKVSDYLEVEERSALVRGALERFVEFEASRRLALLGGTEPELESVPRRRSKGA